ncbi:MAG: CHAT domain-containing protein, partial [Lewinella sp.]|nr:CHAT domain-containing protein [Lewinella sp.]
MHGFPAAIAYYQECLDLRQELFVEPHPAIALPLLGLGRSWFQEQQLDSAWHYFFLAQQMLGQAFVKQAASDPQSWLEATGGMAKVLEQQYIKTQNLTFLAALELQLDSCQQFLQEQRAGFAYQGDKILLAQAAEAVFSAAFTANFKAWESTQDQQYLRKCFAVGAYLKGQQLYEAFKKTYAQNFAGLPAEWLEREQSFYNRYQTLVQKEDKRALLPQVSNSSVDAQLLDLNTDHQAFVAALKAQFPEYYRLKFELPSLGMDFVRRSLLQTDECFLSYFVDEQASYLILLRQDTVIAQRLAITSAELGRLVEALRAGIVDFYQHPAPPDNLYTKMAEQYTTTAARLYDILVAPAAEWLTPRVYVEASGPLQEIPFDALLEKPTLNAQDFSGHAYLGRDHCISYASSAALLWEMRNKQHRFNPSGSVLALAPFFHTDQAAEQVFVGRGDVLAPVDTFRLLPYSGSEVLGVAQLLGGKAWLGKAASWEAL